MVLAAVGQNGLALQHATSKELTADKAFVLEAVSRCGGGGGLFSGGFLRMAAT